MKVLIVIPNWNGAERLKKNMPHVLNVKGVDEIIVSDDASTDDSVQILEKNFPEVRLIKRDKNGGFSSNVNTGVGLVSGDLIFLLNNDAVPGKDCLGAAIPHFNNPKVFSVGFNTGGSWSGAKFEDGFFWHYVAKEVPGEVHKTLWVSGGSGIFRKSIWDELGGLDEIFNPFYEEDVDLGYRAVKRGYINLWEPNSLVEHYKAPGVIKTNFSQSLIEKIAQRNQLIFIWKNITSDRLINEHKGALIRKLINHPKYLAIFLSAIYKLPKILPRREIEKKESKLKDEEILYNFNKL